MKTKQLKDFDFAVQLGLLLVWGAIMVRPLLGGEGASWFATLPIAVIWFWTLSDAWMRWREPGEDERVRHLILMSAYLSRQVSVLAFMALLLLRPVPQEVLPLAMALVLLASELAARRWLGLQDEELHPRRSPLRQSAFRVSWAVAVGFALLIWGVLYFANRNIEAGFTDYSGWGTERPGSPEQAAKAAAAGQALTEKDLAPAPAAPVKGRVLRRPKSGAR